MRRLFWFSLGAGAGYYAARRGERFVAEARERGLVGNVTYAAGTASRLAQNATQAAAGLADRSRSGAGEPVSTTVDPTTTTEGRS